MTISSTNLLQGIPSSGETPIDGMMVNRVQLPSGAAESGNNESGDAEFWTMLSQQLNDVVAQDDVQVIENKDLLALINEFETNLEASDDGSVISVEWMQILKSHFDEASSEVDSPQSTQIPQHAVKSPLEEIHTGEVLYPQQADQLNGEGLPLMWQDQASTRAVVLPAGLNQAKGDGHNITLPVIEPSDNKVLALQNDRVQKMTSSLHLPAADSSIDVTDMEVQSKESDFNNTDLIKDKVIQNQLPREQFNAFNKVSDSLGTVQNNASIIVQPASSPQGQQGQILPPTLQTVTLLPQAQASQWGDAIGERVSFLINHKLNHAEIRIDPPHLGKLDIQIQVKDDSAVVMIQTQHAQTRDLIDSASVRLRDYLQDAGYSSVDVNVSHREQSAQQEGFSQQDSAPDNADVASSDKDSGVTQETGEVMQTMDGVIDYFA